MITGTGADLATHVVSQTVGALGASVALSLIILLEDGGWSAITDVKDTLAMRRVVTARRKGIVVMS